MTRAELLSQRDTLIEQLDAANASYLSALTESTTLQFALATPTGSQKVLKRSLKEFTLAIEGLEKAIARIDAKLTPSSVWGISTRRRFDNPW